jgi:hypothetical protein
MWLARITHTKAKGTTSMIAIIPAGTKDMPFCVLASFLTSTSPFGVIVLASTVHSCRSPGVMLVISNL